MEVLASHDARVALRMGQRSDVVEHRLPTLPPPL
jgi:hypothetical protein